LQTVNLVWSGSCSASQSDIPIRPSSPGLFKIIPDIVSVVSAAALATWWFTGRWLISRALPDRCLGRIPAVNPDYAPPVSVICIKIVVATTEASATMLLHVQSNAVTPSTPFTKHHIQLPTTVAWLGPLNLDGVAHRIPPCPQEYVQLDFVRIHLLPA